MLVNADFAARAVVRPGDIDWTPSPMHGVERKMLDRIGGEVARATSLVRYAPQSIFSAHEHGGGEEFLVLEGVFSDEHGDYPAGAYVRNPVGSRHAPRSEPGCTMLVKLHQFRQGDSRRVMLDSQLALLTRTSTNIEIVLHEFETEKVRLIRWTPGARLEPHGHAGGEEVFVIAGSFADEDGIYPTGTWLRNPPGSTHTPFTSEGCLLYMKVGHLP